MGVYRLSGFPQSFFVLYFFYWECLGVWKFVSTIYRITAVITPIDSKINTVNTPKVSLYWQLTKITILSANSNCHVHDNTPHAVVIVIMITM